MSKMTGKKDVAVGAKVTAIRTGIDDHSNTESDLFNFLRQMHLTGGANGMTHHQGNLVAFTGDTLSNLVVSRKRKAWEGLHAGGSKGGPGRREEQEQEHVRVHGDGEEEGRDLEATGHQPEDEEESVEEESVGGEGRRNWEEEEPDNIHSHLAQPRPSHHHLLSPLHTNFVNEEDIDADNLAADFDGSFTGLGVDINTTNYSMSEAMISLNNIAHHIKTSDSPQDETRAKDQCVILSNYGALDLSSDEAQHPTQEDGEDTPPRNNHVIPPTFSGSVSRDNSQDGVRVGVKRESILRNTKEEVKSMSPMFPDNEARPREGGGGHTFIQPTNLKGNSVITSYKAVIVQGDEGEEYRIVNPKNELLVSDSSEINTRTTEDEDTDSRPVRFQYVLAAPTSIATKAGEPSLTYINQGQSYEIKIKKLGDLSCHYRKKWLRSTIRICFHERRLQYIENEQISEWARTHPNERILEIDTPLSYGMAEVKQDPSSLNSVSFHWDPTRDTGIFVKVHCISTEFTPKKHGGERGVPFRLQVETWSHDDTRLHAAACILQVFKLKGADRKHKQDREKVSKRPDSEKDKFSPQYDCTMLTDLSVDSIYIPSSRNTSPVQSEPEMASTTNKPSSITAANTSSTKTNTVTSIRDISPGKKSVIPVTAANHPSPLKAAPAHGSTDSKTWRILLSHTASADVTAGWLAYNRYGQHVKTFTDYDARDLLRLSKDDLVQMVGLMDGVRLYNDLHMRPVSPRLTMYLAQKGESLFHPILLVEVTVAELVSSVAEMLQVPVGLFHKVIVLGPKKIHIMLTDEFLRYQRPDSAFHYSLVHDEGEACTIHLEPVFTQD